MKKITAVLLTVLMLLAMLPDAGLKVTAAAGDTPAHAKTLTANGDGTYTIALNVTGDSEKKPTKVNVIVVFDTSSSMNTNTGNTEVTYTATDSAGGWNYQNNLYGLVDGSYVELSRQTSGNWPNITYTFWYNNGTTQYTGQRYTRQESNQSRLQAAEAAVNELAAALLAYNGKDGNPADTIEMALVDFANMAETPQQPTTSYDTFSATVNSRNAGNNDRGTNWEAGLREVLNVDFQDTPAEPTYVIFVSDGNPTFYVNNNGTRGGTGQETNDNVATSYNEAVPAAQAIVNAKYEFYTIGVYGNVSRMESLTTASGAPAGNYYSAANTAALQSALAAILEKIEMAGIGNVGITDGTTSNVQTTSGEVSNLLTVDTTSFKYYRKGGNYSATANNGLGDTWSDAPAATFTNGAVKWNIDGVLENGVTYTVTFDCWPSQTTLDIVANIKNDPNYYSTLDSNIKQYIDSNGNLKTNTSASMTYVDTRTGQTGSTNFTNPDPVATQAVKQFAVTKKWENGLDSQEQPPVTLTVTRDGDPCYTVTLGENNVWTKDVYISVGILKTNGNEVKVLEPGHDFTFKEPQNLGYYWELDVPVVRPMLIDGTLTMLIKVDKDHQPGTAKTYTINGTTYYVDPTGGVSLTATNERRSWLDITKAVDGEDADPTQTFPFTVNVVDSKASEGSSSDLNSDYWVWFSVWNSGFIDCLVSGATKEMKNGEWTGYYYAQSGTNVVLNLKKGDNLRFLNLPSGSTYTITEGTLPANYSFTSAVLSGGTDSTFVGGQTSKGTIEDTKTDYLVTYTNTYGLSDVEITKVWDDNSNQDGCRLTVDEFKAKLTLKADGTDVTTANASKLSVTVDPSNSNQYIVKWTGLNRYADGKEIKYTVEEATIDKYTTTGSPAEDHGTITNTHTPEQTTVTITKVWDDSNDIGGIRPASIQVQLKAGEENVGEPVTINANGSWTHTWTGLDKYKDGEEIVYSANEVSAPTGYTQKEGDPAGDMTTGFTVTNIYTPNPVSVDPPVQKIFVNNDSLYNKGDYTFTITSKSAPEGVTAPMPENTSIKNNATFEKEGKKGYYEFGDITFTVPGTYVYTIKEAGSVKGVTNDPTATTGKDITFTVTDDGEGNLQVSPTTDQVELSFTNTYNASGTATLVVNKAISGADWPTDTSLTLTVAGSSGAPMPATTTATLTAAGSATFGPISYTLADAGKTYTYTISEDGFGTGWTGSGDITAVVAVEDKGDGNLEATVTYTPENATITNTYKATGKTELSVTKAISGAAWPTGKSLKLTASGSAGAPAPATPEVTLNAAGTATFGEITFNESHAGNTYTYTISEDGFGKGWTASGTVTATVTVTDNKNGTLTATVVYDPANATITNTYVAEGETELAVTKAITGAAWPTGKNLTLTVTPTSEGAPLPENTTQTLTAAGTVSFGKIALDEKNAGKTYTYTISESGFGEGWTGSGSVTATLVVTDKGDGTLGATVTYSPENATITNTYKAEGEAELSVTKEISGAAWPTGKNLTLTVKGSDGAPMPANTTQTLTAAGTASFGKIAFNESHAGKTFTYTISEDGFGTGWTGSGDVTATVSVTDNGNGKLSTSVVYSPDNAKITNTYRATGTASIVVTKAIKAPEWADQWAEGKTLTLTLNGSTGAPMPNTTTATLTAAGNVTFGPISYTEKDAGKTYTYTVSEDGFGANSGWKGSGDVTATVTVTDNGNGTLATSVAYSPEAKITNTYEVKSVDVELVVNKKLEGFIDDEVPNKFTFVLTDAEDESIVIATKEITASTVEGTTATGSEVLFSKTYDEPGTYKFKLTETADDDVAGMTYSTQVYNVTITVEDDHNGALVAKVNGVEEESTEFDFTNEFKQGTVNVTLELTKVIEDLSNSAKDGKFTFQLKDSEGTVIQEKVVETADLTGSIKFDAIEYEEAGTYKYTLAEIVETPEDGWTYDTKEYPVVVTVSNNIEKAQLEATATIDGTETTKLTVTNTYKAAETELQLIVTKEIEDTADPDYTGTYSTKFQFTLKGDGDVNETVEMTGEGTATFSKIKYTKAGTYNYTITETKGDAEGFTYDTTAYPVTVVVSDEGGKLKAVPTYGEGEGSTSLTVTNKYSAKGEVQLEGSKTVNDKSGSAPDEEFTFVLKKDGSTVETIKAKAVPFKFSALTFDKVGKYTYTIEETKGSTKGFTYDNTKYTVTVTVTDPDKNGLLKVDVSYGEGKTSAEFTNTYEATPAEMTLKATKKLEGDATYVNPDDLPEFTFKLLEGETEKDSKTVKGEGTVSFDKITFTKPGEYSYTIFEEDGKEEGFDYDSTRHQIKVVVTDEGGVLTAKVDGAVKSEIEVEFTNTFTFTPVELTLDPPVKKVITGDKPDSDATFEFVMEADSEDAPMPAGSTDGVKTVTVTGEGEVEFGVITYKAPGRYEYKISEKDTGAARYTYDTSVYTLIVEVMVDGTELKLEPFFKLDEKTVESIVFNNKYKKEEPPTTDATTNERIWTGLSVSTMLSAAGLILLRKKREEEE